MEKSDLPSPVGTDLFDWAVYQQLSEILGGDTIKLVTEFLDSCKCFETCLARIIGEKDKSAFRELCHEIKGAAAMLGFTGLSRLAAEWENGVISGEMPPASSAITLFKTMTEATRAAVAVIPTRGEG